MVTVLGLLAAYLADARARGVTDARVADIERALRRFARELPRLCLSRGRGGEDMALDRITREGIEAWRDARILEVGPGTVRKEYLILRALATWAIERGDWQVLRENVRWMRMSLPRVRPRQPSTMNEDELIRRSKDLPPHVRIIWLAGYVIGDRPGAHCAMRWADVYMPPTGPGAFGHVRLSQRKGGEDRSIPFVLGSGLAELIAQAREQFERQAGRAPRATDPVFLNTRGNAWHTGTLDDAVRYHLRRRRRRKGMPPYAARHSLGTLAASMGLSSSQVALILGHRRRQTAETYIHQTGADAVAARDRMETTIARVARSGHTTP